VVTSTITTSAGEVYLQAGDGWSRVIWRRHAGTACEWTWQAATTPALVQALLQDRAQERRLMLGRRVLASEYVYRDASGEERRAVCRRPRLLARPLVALAVRGGFTTTVDVPASNGPENSP
jgi:hypothetical protein